MLGLVLHIFFSFLNRTMPQHGVGRQPFPISCPSMQLQYQHRLGSSIGTTTTTHSPIDESFVEACDMRNPLISTAQNYLVPATAIDAASKTNEGVFSGRANRLFSTPLTLEGDAFGINTEASAEHHVAVSSRERGRKLQDEDDDDQCDSEITVTSAIFSDAEGCYEKVDDLYYLSPDGEHAISSFFIGVGTTEVSFYRYAWMHGCRQVSGAKNVSNANKGDICPHRKTVRKRRCRSFGCLPFGRHAIYLFGRICHHVDIFIRSFMYRSRAVNDKSP